MNPADQLWFATRQLVTCGTHAAEVMVATMRTAVDALTPTVVLLITGETDRTARQS